MRQIAKELNVQAILTGRVVERGQDLSLYVELLDVVTAVMRVDSAPPNKS